MPNNAPLHDVSSRYGAPMGRANSHPGNAPQDLAAPKFSLQRIPLDSGGYDRGGAYWGHPSDLYWAGSDCGEVSIFLRANSRDAAKAHVRELHPGARFYR